MQEVLDIIFTSTYPWYVAGPLIGLIVPVLLYFGNRHFGVSSSLQHLCRLVLPGSRARSIDYFNYDLRGSAWVLVFTAGLLFGGGLGALAALPDGNNIAPDTQAALAALGITDLSGLVPAQVFSFENLATWQGLVIMLLGGWMIGFGTRYANGCTSGHAITGLSLLSPVSLIATATFFVAGIAATHLLFPLIFGGAP